MVPLGVQTGISKGLSERAQQSNGSLAKLAVHTPPSKNKHVGKNWHAPCAWKRRTKGNGRTSAAPTGRVVAQLGVSPFGVGDVEFVRSFAHLSRRR